MLGACYIYTNVAGIKSGIERNLFTFVSQRMYNSWPKTRRKDHSSKTLLFGPETISVEFYFVALNYREEDCVTKLDRVMNKQKIKPVDVTPSVKHKFLKRLGIIRYL